MIFGNYIRNQEKKLNPMSTKSQFPNFFLGRVYTLVGIPVDLWLQVLTYNPDGLVRSLHECLPSHKFKNLIQEQGILSRRDVHKLSSQYIKLALNICLVPFFI